MYAEVLQARRGSRFPASPVRRLQWAVLPVHSGTPDTLIKSGDIVFVFSKRYMADAQTISVWSLRIPDLSS